jgi:hypothetical protein
MAFDAETVRDAARLVAFGLAPSSRPTNEPDYERLVRRWLDDPVFERAVREVATGLGLRIVEVSEYGATLAGLPGSPFGLTVADYRASLTTEERLLHGLVQLGLAAWLYPRSEDLEAEAEVRRVSVGELDAFLRETCDRLARERPESSDAPSAMPELEEAFRIYRRWPSTKETSDGRRAAKTTTGLIAHALERLAEAGMLRRTGDEAGGTFQALRRYRVQVRELAAHEALGVLRESRR